MVKRAFINWDQRIPKSFEVRFQGDHILGWGKITNLFLITSNFKFRFHLIMNVGSKVFISSRVQK